MADRTAPSDPDNTRAPLVRSEERLRADVHRVPYARVRLEKFVVTETRTVTVEVRREEVRVVHLDALDSAGAGDAVAEGRDDSADRWLTLSEERVAITTEVVPVERVRLQIDTVTGEREVTGDVRVERFALQTIDPSTGDTVSTGAPTERGQA